MGRLGVTSTEIAQAAKKLASENVSVTVEKVRGLLGKGSYGTIGPILKQWKLDNSALLEMKLIKKHGKELPEHLINAVQFLYEQINNEADAKLTTAREEYSNKIESLAGTNNELKNKLGQSNKLNEELTDDNKDQAEQLKVLGSELVIKNSNLEKTIAKLTATENLATERHNEITRLSEINEQQLKSLSLRHDKELAAFREAHSKERESWKLSLNNEHESRIEQVGKLTESAKLLKQEIEQHKKINTAIANDKNKMELLLQSVTLKEETMTGKCAELSETISDLKEQCNLAVSKGNALALELRTKNEAYTALLESRLLDKSNKKDIIKKTNTLKKEG